MFPVVTFIVHYGPYGCGVAQVWWSSSKVQRHVVHNMNKGATCLSSAPAPAPAFTYVVVAVVVFRRLPHGEESAS